MQNMITTMTEYSTQEMNTIPNWMLESSGITATNEAYNKVAVSSPGVCPG